jgi:hypothetical protein
MSELGEIISTLKWKRKRNEYVDAVSLDAST